MKLPGYETLGELGRGGQGAVYRVRDLATGAERALKVLEGALDPETLVRFRREAETLARLEGRGVVPVHHAGVAGGRHYFVMDVMPGGSLQARLLGGPRLEWREVANLGAKLARALERAHALGIVHRDLKPANVLFDDAGEPRLADFGCARDLHAASLTETGTILGTPAYMAPEQLEGRKVSASADVFALGAVLHELLTGERPFEGSTPVRIFQAMRAGRRRRHASEKASSPRALDAILDRALELDPTKRASAGEVAADLEAVAQGRAPDGKAAAGGRLLPVLFGLGALGALGLVGASLARGPGPEPARSASPSPVATLRAPKPASTTPDPKEQTSEALNKFLSAKDHHDRGDDDVAYDFVRRATELDPNLAPARALLAELQIRRGEYDAGCASAARAHELDRTLFPDDTELGSAKDGDLTKDFPAWRPAGTRDEERRARVDALSHNPRSARLWAERAVRGFRQEPPDLAAVSKDAGRALALSPDPDALFVLAHVAVLEGRTRDAIRHANRAVTGTIRLCQFGGYEPFELLAIEHERVEEIAAAYEDLSHALTLHAENLPAHLVARKAFLAARCNKPEAAREVEAAAQASPGDPIVELARAELDANRSRSDDAVTRVAKLGPDLSPDAAVPLAYVRHLRSRLAAGDLESALGTCDRLIAREPQRASVRRLRAHVDIQLDLLANAERDFSYALVLDPELAEVWLERARLRIGRGDRKGAVADITKAIELTADPDDRKKLEVEREFWGQ